MAGRLGELLVRENLISLQQLQKAQEEQKKAGGRIGYHLTKLGFIEESELTSFLSKQYGVPSINLKEFDIDPEVVKLVPRDVAEKHQCVPVNRAGASLILAMSDPSNIYAIDDIKFLTGYNIEVVVASEQAIKEALEKYYAEKGPSYEEVMEGFDENEIAVGHDEDGIADINDLEKSAADAPVVKLVNLILLDAIKKGASDIHVEPYEKDFRVRYRVDGVLYEVMKPPIKLKLGKGREMDFRVSVCPTLFGEKVVMRLLDKSNLQLDMTKLGFDPEPLKAFKDAID
ncbi:MAG: ATPase, T2SS/T4P/T4SS family, partial [Myxococcales bacterium]